MSYDYDWCGNTADEAGGRPCGAPIERWSREWKHRKSDLDADHKAIPQAPVGPLEEGLHLRADRYATALAAAVAADERIAALTELLRQHEYYRSQAESALNAVQEDPQFGTVWAPTGPEPEDVDALLCDQLHRRLYGEEGYHAEGAGYGRPNLADAIGRILLKRLERTSRANEKAQAAEQELNQLRRLISYLTPDDTQQWPTDEASDDVRNVEVIDLEKVRALLWRADCGGAA